MIYPIGGFDSLTGIDVPAFEKMSGGFVFLEGHSFEKPGDIIFDQYYADQKKAHAGDRVKLMNQDWTLAGIVEPGKLAHVFLPITVLQERTASEGKVTQIYLKVDDQNNIATIVDQLKRKYEDYPIFAMRDAIALTSVNNVPLLKSFINVVTGIGVVIGFAVVSLSMYMAVLQRTREIGILKSLGAAEAVHHGADSCGAIAMGLGGTVFGILLSLRDQVRFGEVRSRVTATGYRVLVVADRRRDCGGRCILGAAVSGMLAVRQDPIEALAYE